MGKTLYLECYSGISGDMTVAALLDLGADRRVLENVLKSLPIQGFHIAVTRVMKSGIDACDFDVVLDEAHENHDHDMEYLHGNAAEHVHTENHPHEDHGKHHHEHRGMKEIRGIIDKTEMTDRARSTALKIFEILAQAEAKAHHVSVDEVHFHEVGAVDSIVDIVAVAVCLDNLDVTDVIVPVLYEGCGTVRCQHGILPIPVPAVTNIVCAHQLKLEVTTVQGELVTPTGAAVAAAIRTGEKLPAHFTIEKIGIGAGKRQYECPGILRAMLLSTEEKEHDSIIKLETNVDDCTGEMLGFVMEKLFAAGARDVNYTPVFMKKNRPAWLLTVLCGEADVDEMERILFRETTTIGIRRVRMERSVLPREKREIMTPLGSVEIKVCTMDGKKKYYPEYDSLVRICRERGISYQEAYHMAVEACEKCEKFHLISTGE